MNYIVEKLYPMFNGMMDKDDALTKFEYDFLCATGFPQLITVIEDIRKHLETQEMEEPDRQNLLTRFGDMKSLVKTAGPTDTYAKVEKRKIRERLHRLKNKLKRASGSNSNPKLLKKVLDLITKSGSLSEHEVAALEKSAQGKRASRPRKGPPKSRKNKNTFLWPEPARRRRRLLSLIERFDRETERIARDPQYLQNEGD